MRKDSYNPFIGVKGSMEVLDPLKKFDSKRLLTLMGSDRIQRLVYFASYMELIYHKILNFADIIDPTTCLMAILSAE